VESGDLETGSIILVIFMKSGREPKNAMSGEMAYMTYLLNLGTGRK
jgi:hypothetical protein